MRPRDLFGTVFQGDTLSADMRLRGMDAVLTRMKIWWDNRAQSRSETGANLIEYMLLLVLIAVIVVLVVTGIGQTLSTKYGDASSSLHP